MAYTGAEVKSGVFVTLSLGLLLGLTVIVGRFSAHETRTWEIEFGYISGLEKNAPVRYAGHEVGKVRSIEVRGQAERPIVVTVDLDASLSLKQGTEAFIDTLGMMGEKYVEIKPGDPAKPVLGAGQVLYGTDPIPMYLLVEKMNLMADRMDELTQSLNPLMEEMNGVMSSNKEEISGILTNINQTSEAMNKLLNGNKEEIARILSNFDQSSANIRDMTHDLKFRPWRILRKD